MAHFKKIPLVEDRTENRLWAKAEAGSRAGRPRLMAAAWTGCSSGGADMMDVGRRKKGAGVMLRFLAQAIQRMEIPFIKSNSLKWKNCKRAVLGKKIRS